MIFESRDLVVRYSSNRPPALSGVSMRVPSACLYAVLGPNGSGKSTLLRALLGSIPISAGSVSIDGLPTKSWTAPAAGALGRGCDPDRERHLPYLGASARSNGAVPSPGTPRARGCGRP